MKKITLLIFTIALISCAQAEQKQNVVDKTTLAYGNYLLKLPTDMLPNAVVIGGNSTDSNYLEGVAVKFNDKQSLWGGVFFEEPTSEQIGSCSGYILSDDLEKSLEKVKNQLNGHKLQQQYLAIIEQSSCQFGEEKSSIHTDLTSRYIIFSQCKDLQCDTYVVEKNNARNSQILMLFSKGFNWSWVKKIIKGA